MPRPTFKPVIKRARIGTPGFTADSMARFGNLLNNSIISRFNSALDIYDQAAKPLAEGYKKFKTDGKYHGEPIRNLRLTGRLQRSMKLLRASQNHATIGFADPESNNRMRLNQARSFMYGVSPKDEAVLLKAVREYLFSTVAVEVKSA